jgi:hypothetical protein
MNHNYGHRQDYLQFLKVRVAGQYFLNLILNEELAEKATFISLRWVSLDEVSNGRELIV